MDVKGEQARMSERDGAAEVPKADFGAMSYAELAAYVVENQLSSVINLAIYEEEDVAELRDAVRKEVEK
jgi:hypothetical protein